MPALTAVVEDAKGADIVWIGDRYGCREIVLIDEDSIHRGLGVCNGNVPDKSDGAGTGRRLFLCRREIHQFGTRAERRMLANRHQGLVRHSHSYFQRTRRRRCRRVCDGDCADPVRSGTFQIGRGE